MLHHMNIDIETYSSVDIKKSGLYKYVQAPDFQVLLFAYSIDGGPVEIIDLTREAIPGTIIGLLFDPSVVKHAYNAPFEWYCLSKLFAVPEPEGWLSQWRCTMFHGLFCGYTAGLAATGEALGLPQDKRKLGTGMSLIRTFCVPCKPTKTNGYRTRTLPAHEPEKWELFKTYCRQDVAAEMEIQRRLSAFPIPEDEQRLWELDQRMNSRGVAVDVAFIESALALAEGAAERLTVEAVSISGLNNPKSVGQLKKWLEDEGEEVADLQKDTVKGIIADTENGDVRRMLEIRQELSKTSVKKYDAMMSAVCADGRARGLLQFYGANRTGRWAGRLVQVQNLPKNEIETLDLARELALARKADAISIIYGSIPDTLSQLVRTAFVPAEGNRLVVADFSAIEARVISWLAGESWRQEVFATHGKIYEASAANMFGVPLEKIVKGNPEYALRQKGKVAELALGYQGGAGALVKMGALKQGIAEDELPEIVQRWRQTNKRIVDLWYAMDGAALEAMRTGRPSGTHGILFAREGDHATSQDFLTMTLPGGRKLYYARPFLSPNKWGNDSINYRGMDQQTKKWSALETYGGKLTENCIQAIARDCLALSIRKLEAAGYRIVMHVHDEVVVECPAASAEADLERICAIMGEPIPWAPGLLLKAAGFVTEFYKKD